MDGMRACRVIREITEADCHTCYKGRAIDDEA